MSCSSSLCSCCLIPFYFFHAGLLQKKPFTSSARVATALLPTLVFTLVLSRILREQFDVPEYLIGALVIYTLASTIIPGIVCGHRSSSTSPRRKPPTRRLPASPAPSPRPIAS